MILLDTHVIFWLGFDDGKLSGRARRTISEARQEKRLLAASAVSLYELGNLVTRSRLQLDIPVLEFLEGVERDFVVLHLTARIATAASSVPATYPRDPFDRIIGATALVHGLELVTADDRIRRSGLIRTIW